MCGGESSKEVNVAAPGASERRGTAGRQAGSTGQPTFCALQLGGWLAMTMM